ncbi:segregation and condensation protein A [Allocatelliglobosispora scoriae]|uniref:Segregation and condensation protein A n=1 Tax=Allocatelliglobosispora scoriae TaxID=643052 RepID=A0A841C0G1_9ACTN|nr:segregation/condensation protein A [Allocatelliglobosispora scoriae]MBB5873228.1 segregation and condensation protein A [Allocatelliglobosispora scoriae]
MTAVPDQTLTPEAAASEPVVDGRFRVRLINFEGPFDLLLQLIGKHKLDVTEVALHTVTDDFIAHIRSMGDDWDLDEASEFLVIAATLLDLKAARLLPAAEVEDEEDLELLSARDLLFARLLQYRAFKQAAAYLAELAESGQRRWPRSVQLEPRFADALPDLVLGIGPERLAKIALRVFTPKPPPALVSVAHIHQVRVSVPEHAERIRERLRKYGKATFLALTVDCESTLEVVARFLALLELYRAGQVTFEQPDALGELTVIWTYTEDAPPPDFEIDTYGDDDADTVGIDDEADSDDEADDVTAAAEPLVAESTEENESAGDDDHDTP